MLVRNVIHIVRPLLEVLYNLINRLLIILETSVNGNAKISNTVDDNLEFYRKRARDSIKQRKRKLTSKISNTEIQISEFSEFSKFIYVFISFVNIYTTFDSVSDPVISYSCTSKAK